MTEGSSVPVRCFVIVGAAGCGKSTFARELCHVLSPVAMIDIEPCIEQLLAVGMQCAGIESDDRDSAKYKAIFRDPIHEQLFTITRQQLHVAQLSCALIAPFTTERRSPGFCRWLRTKLEWKGPLHVFFMHCQAAERKERVVGRALSRDAKKFATSVAYWETSNDSPAHIQSAKDFDGEDEVRVTVLDVTDMKREQYRDYLLSIRDDILRQ